MFNYESKFKKFFFGGAGGGGDWRGRGARVSEFFSKNLNLKKNLFWGHVGGGGLGGSGSWGGGGRRGVFS